MPRQNDPWFAATKADRRLKMMHASGCVFFAWRRDQADKCASTLSLHMQRHPFAQQQTMQQHDTPAQHLCVKHAQPRSKAEWMCDGRAAPCTGLVMCIQYRLPLDAHVTHVAGGGTISHMPAHLPASNTPRVHSRTQQSPHQLYNTMTRHKHTDTHIYTPRLDGCRRGSST